jgi:hypothetical protein
MVETRVTLSILQSEINRWIRNPIEFVLAEGATVVDVIHQADQEIRKHVEKFPVNGYHSLLHMVYHPIEERFYKQVAIQGYIKPGHFLNIRNHPKTPLPKKVTIILIPDGPCISDREEPLKLDKVDREAIDVRKL